MVIVIHCCFHTCGLPAESVVSNESVEVVYKFCYLGYMISAGGFEESIVARIRCDWKEFKEHLPVHTSKVFSLHRKCKIFQVCARSVVAHGCETLAVKEEDLAKLELMSSKIIWGW